MMLDPPRLRRARAEDAATAAPLLVQALDVLALELAGVECLEAAVPLFHELFRLPGNRYSHAHAWVLDGTAGVVGVLLAYPGRDEALLAEATLDWLRARAPGRALVHQPESDPGEFYLDALAVAGSQRGRGLAAVMIDSWAMRASDCWWTMPSRACARCTNASASSPMAGARSPATRMRT